VGAVSENVCQLTGFRLKELNMVVKGEERPQWRQWRQYRRDRKRRSSPYPL